MLESLSLTIPNLRKAFAGGMRPADMIAEIYRRISKCDDYNIFISTYPMEEVIAKAEALGTYDPGKPLWGIPFAVKDNIDAEGLETTAGCPAFAYMPKQDAFAVAKLREAGALLIGKTNLDQFATGLVGTRSPWGPCRNAFDPQYVSGGSSSGSAVAVSLGLASFALGTDTAGSGRVPAAFNNIVGLKPTFGRISIRGVVPACKTVDCVSIFALTPGDASEVLNVAGTQDPSDSWSRNVPRKASIHEQSFKFGLPNAGQLEFFGNSFYEQAFETATDFVRSLGGEAHAFDYRPFAETASLLYEGPWVAERSHAVNALTDENPDSVLPVIREILAKGAEFSALDTFEARYRLQELRSECAEILNQIDFILLPTAPTHPTIDSVNADPIIKNKELGIYTNFVNLLGLCAVATPAGFIADSGLPFGVSLIGPSGSETMLLEIATQVQRNMVESLGATGQPIPKDAYAAKIDPPASMETVRFAVCGAHLSGQPLNYQLTDLGGILIRSAKTAPHYRFYALNDNLVSRPGLVRQENGASIEVELWEVPVQSLGTFIDGIRPPLGVGRVELADGTDVLGFLCEGYAIQDATDITEFAGWRTYIESLANRADSNEGMEASR
ncbi:MAG: allophanate hydrolase [Gammaproteobacteria bacterium]